MSAKISHTAEPINPQSSQKFWIGWGYPTVSETSFNEKLYSKVTFSAMVFIKKLPNKQTAKVN